MRNHVTLRLCFLLMVSCAHRGVAQGIPEQPLPEPVATDLFLPAKTLEAAGKRREALGAYLSLRRERGATPEGQEALFQATRISYDLKDFAGSHRLAAELLGEAPLSPRAPATRRYLGYTAYELKSYAEAAATLRAVAPDLPEAERAEALAVAARAESMADSGVRDVRAALERRAAVQGTASQAAGESAFVEAVEKAPLNAVEQLYRETPPSHPGWPTLALRLGRIYAHIRDIASFKQVVARLTAEAPSSPAAADLRTLAGRIERREQVRPRVLGALLPLSGNYRAFGQSVLRGLKLALAGSDVELKTRDTQGDPARVPDLVAELALDEGAIAIVGPLLTDEARRAALEAEDLGIPIITLARTSGITAIGENVFRMMVTNEQQAEALVNFAMNTLGYRTFALMYPRTSFGEEIANAFWDEVLRRGGTIRGVETYERDQKSFTEPAKKLVGRYYLEDRESWQTAMRQVTKNVKSKSAFARKKALERAKGGLPPVVDFQALLLPDSWQTVSLIAPALAVEDVVTNGCDERDKERIQKTIGREKISTVTLLGPSSWASPKGASDLPMLIERGGKYVQCSYYVDAFYEDSTRRPAAKFVEAFRKEVPDGQITLLDAMAYDAGGLVRSILDRGRPSTRAAFRSALAGVKGYAGASGELSFDNLRQLRTTLVILELTPTGIKEAGSALSSASAQ